LFKTINRWLAEAGVMMTQGTLVDATIIEAPALPEQRAATRSGDASDQKGNQWHFGMKAPLVSMPEWPDPQPESPRPTSMTSISWVICFMERSNLSQPMPATWSATARGAAVDVDWLIAERPGGKNRSSIRARTKRPSTSNT
jgi:IS5 family transposase